MKHRGSNINSNDGNGLYRLCISIWVNELMRVCCNNEFIISNTICRARYSGVSVGGI